MNAKIIYGTAWKKERTSALVVSAVLNGFRAIDTACQLKHYREDLVGEALVILKEQHGIAREELFIQTKYTPIGGQDRSQPLPYVPSDSVSAQITSSFATSLRYLRTSYLDAYLLHSPLDTLPRTLEAWAALCALQDAGTVRAVGVSNCYNVRLLRALETAAGRRVQIVQNRWYEGNTWDGEVLQYCRANGVQYQSFWTLTGSPSLLKHPSLLALARSNNCTPEQAVYRTAQAVGVTPLSGTTSVEHMREAVAAENVAFAEDTELWEVKEVLGA